MNDSGDAPLLSIGALAARTGLNVSAIRYYEAVGLIPAATRRPSGHRVYGSDAEALLTLIRHCRDFGFSLEDTRALVSLASNGERDCVEARDITRMHLAAVRSRLAELQALARSLGRFVASCDAQCAGGPAPRCTIFTDLGGGVKPRRAGARVGGAGGCCG